MTPILQIKNLGKNFGATPVLHDVNFSLEPQTLTAILGASGSGKTTLLRLIAGFEQPNAGEIHLDGKLIASSHTSRKPQNRAIGYVAQEGALFPHLNVADNITFGLPWPQRRTRHRVGELLTLIGLPLSYASRTPQTLSGGEQQRVALARALAPRPHLILLDEPFSALDAALREQTRHAAAAAIHAAGATAILVTHDQAEALSMGGRVGVLQNGTLKQFSTPQTLYRQPTDAALADFVGAAVLTPGTAYNGHAESALGRLTLAPDEPNGAVDLMIRPEQIRIFNDPSQGGVPARIEQITFYGHDASIRLSLKSAPATHVTARAFSHSLPLEGTDVWLRVEGNVVAYPAEKKSQPQTVE